MCLYPKFILNRKYLPNLKNNYNPPQIQDERTKFVPVGCGKCMECLKQKARSWQVRLHEELRTNKSGKFVTLTFSDESIIELEKHINPDIKDYYRDNEICTLAIRRFLERWRKQFKKSVRHWLVTELGQNNTERIHIHGIIFTDKSLNELRNIWKYGNVNKRDHDWTTTYVSERTINYIVKYLHKIDPKHKYYTPKILCSKGIGSNYLSRIDSNNNIFKGIDTNQLYKTKSGQKLNLPIYYRNKLYTDSQRENLWINLLNTNTRYINKIKIDVSKNEDSYFKVLDQQRKLNKLLGYGDDKKDWNRIKYERQLRKLKSEERRKKLSQA